jgi:hypothetical protein
VRRILAIYTKWGRLGKQQKGACLCCIAEIFVKLLFQPVVDVLAIPVSNVPQRDTVEVGGLVDRDEFRDDVKLSADETQWICFRGVAISRLMIGE